MDNTSSLYDPKLHGDSEKVENYRFRHEVFEESLQDIRATNPRFKSVPLDNMADMIGLSRSNFRRLRNGEVPDPRSSTIWLICSALHMPPYKLLGLPAPQTATAPAPVSHELHMRDLERRDEANARELERLHNLVLEKSEKASACAEQARAAGVVINEQRDTIKRLHRQRKMLVAATVTMMVISAIFCGGIVGLFL